jgi:hypothetical protein
VANIGEPLRVFEEPEDDPVTVPEETPTEAPGRACPGWRAVSIIAFRRWNVSDGGYLMPLNRGTTTLWRPGAVRFECECNGPGIWATGKHEHVVLGQPGRVCGLYSYRQPIAACQCDAPDDPHHGVVGVVKVWGEVCEHERGWRSSWARPVAVVDFTGRLAAGYDLPRYPDLAALYSEWAPDLEPAAVDSATWCDRWAGLTSIMATIQIDTTALDKAIKDMFSGGIVISGTFQGSQILPVDPAEEEYRTHCRALGLDDATADRILERAKYAPIWNGSMWDTAKNLAALAAAGATAAQAWQELAALVAAVEKANTPAPAPKTGPPVPAPGHQAYGKPGRRRRPA